MSHQQAPVKPRPAVLSGERSPSPSGLWQQLDPARRQQLSRHWARLVQNLRQRQGERGSDHVQH